MGLRSQCFDPEAVLACIGVEFWVRRHCAQKLDRCKATSDACDAWGQLALTGECHEWPEAKESSQDRGKRWSDDE